MPGRDRTGPRGFGPMTGRGMGFCAGVGAGWRQGFRASPGAGTYGWGGRGRRNVYYATGVPGWARGRDYWGAPAGYGASTAEDEYNDLRDQAAGLEEELRAVKERMEALQRERAQSGEGQ